ncbi:hypothetical protein Tco_1207774 [Tanacetum coccineum]
MGFINGKTVRNENDALLQDQWDRRNSVLLMTKKVWDELEETYNKEDGSFDALVNLPNCTCAGAEALKKHNQLLRCFELVGYPSNFKKRDNQNVSSNAAVAGNKVDHKPGPSVTHTFTDDHLQKLVALISDKSGSGCVPVNVAGFYSKEPGGTGSEKGGLYFFETETRSDEPYDDKERDKTTVNSKDTNPDKERDKTTVNSKDTNPSSLGGTENASSTKKDDGGHPGTPE